MVKKLRTAVDFTGIKEAIDSVRDDEVWRRASYSRKMRFIIISYLISIGILPAQAEEDISKYHFTKTAATQVEEPMDKDVDPTNIINFTEEKLAPVSLRTCLELQKVTVKHRALLKTEPVIRDAINDLVDVLDDLQRDYLPRYKLD